jgi:putative effector of murein hydrolase
MMRFDRFKRDLLRHLWFNCIYGFILLIGVPVVLESVAALIFGFSTLSTVKLLPYSMASSLAISVAATLFEELVKLKREVDRLKLADGAQVQE